MGDYITELNDMEDNYFRLLEGKSTTQEILISFKRRLRLMGFIFGATYGEGYGNEISIHRLNIDITALVERLDGKTIW